MKKAKPHESYRPRFIKALREVKRLQKQAGAFNWSHLLYDELGEAMDRAIQEAGFRQSIWIPKEKRKAIPDPPRWNLQRAEALLGEDAYMEVFTPFRERADFIRDVNRERLAKARVMLSKLARVVPVREGEASDPDFEVDMVSSYTFRQHSAHEFYAETRAQIQVDYLEKHTGAELAIYRRPTGSWVDFVIKGNLLDQIDLEVLKNYPPAPMLWFVKACWERKVDPRIYRDGIPYSYEVDHGLKNFEDASGGV